MNDFKNNVIYKVTNTINGKCYIGQTSYGLDYRRKDHINDASRKIDNFVFHKALRKYPANVFVWEVLFNSFKQEHLNDLEEYFIDLFKSHTEFGGYNQTLGGGGRRGYHLSDETKALISSKIKGVPQAPERAKRSKQEILKAVEKQKIPIVDQNGVIYESIAAAARANGLNPGGIGHVLKGKSVQTGGGLKFAYVGQEISYREKKVTRRNRVIVDQDGIEYESVTYAALLLGVSKSLISMYLDTETKVRGFLFKKKVLPGVA